MAASVIVSAAEGYSETIITPRGIKIIDHFPSTDSVTINQQRLASVNSMIPWTPPVPLEATFTLHSRPGASKTIYLDFDGHIGFEGAYTPYNLDGDDRSFSDAELIDIQKMWTSVVEDFLPFDVNVTTEDPGPEALRNTGDGDTEWGIRVVVDGSNIWCSYGSWAYVGSFDEDTDYEAYICMKPNHWLDIADSISHEVGHSLGLHHDGPGYYEGHGVEGSDTYWTPIMGWTSYFGVSTWSKGEYSLSNNDQDDLEIITTENGFSYRVDDHGSIMEEASFIDVNSALINEGNIEQNSDVDFFEFTTNETGTIALLIQPDILAANLDIEAKLFDSSGTVISTSNPATKLHAEFDITLNAGTFYLSVEGTGYDDPESEGYSDYASLGYYSITSLSPFSCSQGCFSFDIDLDEKLEADALTDGLLVIRHLFGFSGDSLISGAISNGATRQEAEEITSYLSDAESELDIDGDGEAGALTDGLLLIRYLFGFSGDSLISGAVSENAQRTTAEQIEAYISERIPAI